MTAAMHGTPTNRAATVLPRLLPHGSERTQDWHAHSAWHGSLPYRDAACMSAIRRPTAPR